ASLGLLLHFQHRFETKMEAEVGLAMSIARIHQADARLASFVQLALVSGQGDLRDSYKFYRRRLEQDLSETLAQAEPELGALQTVNQAQQALSKLDEQAFLLSRNRQARGALALLSSKQYQRASLNKSLYLDVALDKRQSHLHSQTATAHQLMLLFQLLMLFDALLLMHFWRKMRSSRLDALQVTMRTVMDVVNNNLNRLQLQQLRLKKLERLSPEDFQEFRSLIRETSGKLKAIGEMQSFRTHGRGATELLHWDEGFESEQNRSDCGTSPSVKKVS
ncbi:MAG: hypothetical protein ACAI44_26775, partial [Candidatus Sericytochromatia bacterium]